MTGHESKRAAAQDNITDEQGRPMTYWGGKAQPAQDMEFARIRIQVGNKFVEGFLTHAQLLRADNPWALIEHKVAICVATLKEIYEQKT